MFSTTDNKPDVSGSAHRPIANEESNKILSRYSRQEKDRERPARPQLCPTSEIKASVASTIPAPTRFTRKTRTVDRNQSGALSPQLLIVHDNKLLAKLDTPYDSLLFQLMESSALDMDAVKAHISTKDMYLNCETCKSYSSELTYGLKL
jgi:hypothetical protein